MLVVSLQKVGKQPSYKNLLCYMFKCALFCLDYQKTKKKEHKIICCFNAHLFLISLCINNVMEQEWLNKTDWISKKTLLMETTLT